MSHDGIMISESSIVKSHVSGHRVMTSFRPQSIRTSFGESILPPVGPMFRR